MVDHATSEIQLFQSSQREQGIQLLKPNWIDYEEYNFEEFTDKVVSDDKFNARWANGCTRELSLEERYEIMQANIKTATLGKPSSYDSLYYDSKNIPTKTIIN